jgi:hypothetical protein
MVCTVLTGILEMAILENMWPPTWNIPIGNVFAMIAWVGMRTVENRMSGDMNSSE